MASREGTVPILRGEERLVFEHARKHELVFQRCGSCGAVVWYPRVVCPQCMGTSLAVVCSTGRGHIHSFTTLFRAGAEERAADVPYTVVLVDLDEGARVIGDLSGVAPEEVRVGLRVTVTFVEVAENVNLPAFILESATGE